MWQENRRKTYQGSFQHFLRALVAGRTEEEGFTIHEGALEGLQKGHGKYIYPAEIQLESVSFSLLKRWTFDGWLRIDRRIEGRSGRATSQLKDPVLL